MEENSDSKTASDGSSFLRKSIGFSALMVVLLIGTYAYLHYQQYTTFYEGRATCLFAASQDETSDWSLKCKTSGIDKKEADCHLPGDVADRVWDSYHIERQFCLDKYPLTGR